MRIRKIEMTRLWAVSETPNEDDHYDLVPFDIKDADFNQEFEHASLDEELDALVDNLYGNGGKCIEVDETDVETSGEFLRIQVGEDCIEVPDILDKVNVDADNATIYLVVDRALENGTWVVAERCSA